MAFDSSIKSIHKLLVFIPIVNGTENKDKLSISTPVEDKYAKFMDIKFMEKRKI